MNIHIVGGGAIGLFFAAQWSAHHRVTLQTKTAQQQQALQEKGITVIENGEETVHFIETAEQVPAQAELVVAAVKQYQLKDVLSVLPASCPLLFIQNGLSHFGLFNQLPQPVVYAASVTHGAVRKTSTAIQLNGRNSTKIASVKNGLQTISKQLSTPGFPFEWHDDAKEMLLEKMAVNAVINPLTALLQVKNGELNKNSQYKTAAEDLCSEFAAVFPAHTREQNIKAVQAVCEKTAHNESSMLMDVKEGRATEIEAIVGAVLEEAAAVQAQVPKFTFLYQLLKGKEAGE